MQPVAKERFAVECDKSEGTLRSKVCAVAVVPTAQRCDRNIFNYANYLNISCVRNNYFNNIDSRDYDESIMRERLRDFRAQ